MKFCYLDENVPSGQLSPVRVLVMSGIIVDAHWISPTKQEWKNISSFLSKEIGREVKEFRAKNFYNSGGWRWSISREKRAGIISMILDWMAERRHQVVFSAIDTNFSMD